MKFRKRPVIVEASQWMKDGDHAEVSRVPLDQYNTKCPCGLGMLIHGWITAPFASRRLVCPTNWVMEDIPGELSVVEDGIFKRVYQEVPESGTASKAAYLTLIEHFDALGPIERKSWLLNPGNRLALADAFKSRDEAATKDEPPLDHQSV